LKQKLEPKIQGCCSFD